MEKDELSISIDFAGLLVNGVHLSSPFPAVRLSELLCLEPRLFKGAIPAPTGHRNNWRYIYDGLGMRLTDRHDTQLVTEIEVYLRVGDFPKDFEPKSEFRGLLSVLDVSVDASTPASRVIAQSPSPFEQKLPGEWSCRYGGRFIDLVVSPPGSSYCERNALIRSVAVNLDV